MRIEPKKTYEKTHRLVILEINDTHGYAWPENGYGGFAAISSEIKKVRKEAAGKGWDLLFLHAGDVNVGMPESDLFAAEPDILALNEMMPDAMAIGNHEFDHPESVLSKQIEAAKFPVISANIVGKGTGEPFARPYVIKEFDGFKAAILGLTTKRTEYTANPGNVKDLEFLPPSETAALYVPKLRETVGENGIVVVLAHLGVLGFPETEFDGSESDVRKAEEADETNDPYGGSVSLAKTVPGIDVIIDGHTHTRMSRPMKVNGAIIIQAGAYSKCLARLDLAVEGGKVSDLSYELMKIKDSEPDAETEKILRPYREKAAVILEEEIGHSDAEFFNENDITRKSDTPIGHLVTDAMTREASKNEKIHAALIDGGRIRTGIPAGRITYGDLLRMLPYGDKITILKINGTRLLEAIEWGAVFHPQNTGARLNSAGLSYRVTPEGVEDLLINGEGIAAGSTYTIAVNDYIADGGDNYSMLKCARRTDTGILLADAVKEYVRGKGRISPCPFSPRWTESGFSESLEILRKGC